MAKQNGSDLESGIAVIITGLTCALILLPIEHFVSKIAGQLVGYIFLAVFGIVLARLIYRRVFDCLSRGR